MTKTVNGASDIVTVSPNMAPTAPGPSALGEAPCPPLGDATAADVKAKATPV